MQKNEILTLTAETLGADLEGVCRHDGMAVFVPGMLAGETAKVQIVKTEKRYAFGKMVSAPEIPSPARREPDCRAYPQCGGCAARHILYEETLAAKRQHVEDCFRRIGKLNVTVPETIGMEHPFAYRNKTALPIGGTAEDPALGFFAPRSHRLIPAGDCPNAMAPAAEIARAVQAWIRENKIQPYHEETGTGLLRHLVTRVNRKSEAMVTIVVNGKKLPHAEELYERLQARGHHQPVRQ